MGFGEHGELHHYTGSWHNRRANLKTILLVVPVLPLLASTAAFFGCSSPSAGAQAARCRHGRLAAREGRAARSTTTARPTRWAAASVPSTSAARCSPRARSPSTRLDTGSRAPIRSATAAASASSARRSRRGTPSSSPASRRRRARWRSGPPARPTQRRDALRGRHALHRLRRFPDAARSAARCAATTPTARRRPAASSTRRRRARQLGRQGRDCTPSSKIAGTACMRESDCPAGQGLRRRTATRTALTVCKATRRHQDGRTAPAPATPSAAAASASTATSRLNGGTNRTFCSSVCAVNSDCGPDQSCVRLVAATTARRRRSDSTTWSPATARRCSSRSA